MINTEITTTKGMEQAQRQMEQAKNRMALEKKKANEERRRKENAHKYMMGGVVHKYFQECYCFEESEMNEILKVALATPQCQKVIADIKARANEPIDFDFNLLILNADDYNHASDLKEDVREAFNIVLERNGWDDCDDSISALTTKKMVFKKGNKTPFSIDVCIVKKDGYGLHRLIHRKTGFVNSDQWYWNQVPNSHDLREKEAYLKPDYWHEVRDAYLVKKNMYLRRPYDNNYPSFICYVEAVNEVYNKVICGVSQHGNGWTNLTSMSYHHIN